MADLPPANLILQALHAIRTELRGFRDAVNTKLDQTNARLDETNARLDESVSRLTRLEKATTRGFLATNSKLATLAKKVSEHDRRLDHLPTKGLGAQVRTLQERVGRIEARLLSPRTLHRPRRSRPSRKR